MLEYFSEKNYKNEILRIGLPDKYIEHGTQAQLYKMLGIDADGLYKKIKKFVQNKTTIKKVSI